MRGCNTALWVGMLAAWSVRICSAAKPGVFRIFKVEASAMAIDASGGSLSQATVYVYAATQAKVTRKIPEVRAKTHLAIILEGSSALQTTGWTDACKAAGSTCKVGLYSTDTDCKLSSPASDAVLVDEAVMAWSTNVFAGTGAGSIYKADFSPADDIGTLAGNAIGLHNPSGAKTCGTLVEVTSTIDAMLDTKLRAVYDSYAFPEEAAHRPCELFDFAGVFPKWAWTKVWLDTTSDFPGLKWIPDDAGILLPTTVGYPFAAANADDILCPNEWWHTAAFQQTRSAGWVALFVITLITFFAASCCLMPRLNGRRDTTGFCGKAGNALQDKLDKNSKILAWKRARTGNWNGMLAAVFKHFNTSGTGYLSPDEFDAFFSTCGDGFINAALFRDACATFGTELADASGVVAPRVDLNAIDTMYTLGLKTWRERHVQAQRDFERAKLLSDEWPDYTHSEYLVTTGSIGPEGLLHYKQTLEELRVDGATAKKRVSAKQTRLSVDAKERTSQRLVDIAAKGGKAFAAHIDEEFDVELAMTEAMRQSVPLPSLYVETWIFTLICAFIFLFLYDFTRWLEGAILQAQYYDADCARANWIDKDAQQECLDGSPSSVLPNPANAHDWFIPLWLLSKTHVVADVGHKVCLFHFFFIALCVLPVRLAVVLRPASWCAKRAANRMKAKPTKLREYRPLKAHEIKTINVQVSEEQPPGTKIVLTYGDAEDAKAFSFDIPEGARMNTTVKAVVPLDDAEGIPQNCLITAGNMSLRDKIALAPLYLVRDVCGYVVSIFQFVGISLGLFIFFAPFIDFKRRSLELAHIRVAGISFVFAADPFDAYMRWLNLEIVNMLTFGWFKKIYKAQAERMYLGFLDRQISWNVAPKHIPKGLDTSQKIVYFAADVDPNDVLLQKIILLPLLLTCGVWPNCFAKHASVAAWKLWLSKIRFGGRQPRLSGVFLNPKHSCVNQAGCVHVSKWSVFTGLTCLQLPLLEGRFEKMLEENIEWVVPPPAPKKGCCKHRWTYVVPPFPFDKGDEDALSMDTAIPVVVDKVSAFDFPLKPGSDANALDADDIAYSLERWAKADRSGQRREILAKQLNTAPSGPVTHIDAKALMAKASMSDKITAHDLADMIEAFSLLSLDVRATSPVFARTQKNERMSSLFSGFEHELAEMRSTIKVTANPLRQQVQAIAQAEEEQAALKAARVTAKEKRATAKEAKRALVKEAVDVASVAAAVPLSGDAAAQPVGQLKSLAKAVRAEQPGERRVASDGNSYTKEEFVDHYGGLAEWMIAESCPGEYRTAKDGETYTKEEFIAHYGGTDEWDVAPILDTHF